MNICFLTINKNLITFYIDSKNTRDPCVFTDKFMQQFLLNFHCPRIRPTWKQFFMYTLIFCSFTWNISDICGFKEAPMSWVNPFSSVCATFQVDLCSLEAGFGWITRAASSPFHWLNVTRQSSCVNVASTPYAAPAKVSTPPPSAKVGIPPQPRYVSPGHGRSPPKPR